MNPRYRAYFIDITMLSYKDYAVFSILEEVRNIRFASCEQMYSQYNSVSVDVNFKIDLKQLEMQADVFAREMLTKRSLFDMKRFLGQYQRDWKRILAEAYIYDRLKCIYYGINATGKSKTPKDLFSFPGNILLYRILKDPTFSYNLDDSQPFSLAVNIEYEETEDVFKEVFKKYPLLKEGMSTRSNIVSYVNTDLEAVMKGLANAEKYLKGSKNIKVQNLFQVFPMNDSKIESFTEEGSNPILNSCLHTDGTKFMFYFPANESGPDKMHFNESIYFSRAVGMSFKNLDYSGNRLYTVVDRDTVFDGLAKEEVFAITGLKTEIVPLTSDQMQKYMNMNSYVAPELDPEDFRGGNGGTP